MKQVSLPLLLLVVACKFIYAQPTEQKLVLQTLKTFSTALNNKDATAAGDLLTSDYALNSFGLSLNKEQRIAAIKSGQIIYELFKDENIKIIQFPNTATAEVKVNGSVKATNGVTSDLKLVVFTLNKKENKWLIAGECNVIDCYK